MTANHTGYFLSLLAVLVSLSASLVGQPAKTKMVEGYALHPIVIKDEGCARDYVKASATSGIELRKRMAELVTYGCIEQTSYIYHVFVAKSVRIAVGAKTVLFKDVMMILAVDLEKLVGRTGAAEDAAGNFVLGKSGLIDAKEFLPYTEKQMEEFLKTAVRH